jgi:hypothetical protein
MQAIGHALEYLNGSCLARPLNISLDLADCHFAASAHMTGAESGTTPPDGDAQNLSHISASTCGNEIWPIKNIIGQIIARALSVHHHLFQSLV